MIRQNGGVGSEVGGVCCVGESVHHCLPKKEVSVGWFVLADQRGYSTCNFLYLAVI